MRGGALAFVGYNMVFGLGVPGIDMAAHLGGLVVGFVCGLVLTAVTPSHRGGSAGCRRASGEWPCWRSSRPCWPASDPGDGHRLSADARRSPDGPKITGQRDAVEAWNAFNTSSEPVFREFERIDKDLAEVTERVDAGKVSDEAALRTIALLKEDCRSLEPRIPKLPAANGEIQEVRKHLLTAQSHKLRLVTRIEEIVAAGGAAALADPRELDRLSEAYVGEFKAVARIRDAYFKAHGMQPAEKAP